MVGILDLRARIPCDVFDYRQLMDCLGDYAKPRDKIGTLLRGGDLVRIKKGLYAFSDRCRRNPLSLGLLANLIYGPSHVSLDFALAHYGLIPERVEIVTCVTTGGRRRFETPVGTFTYQPQSAARFAVGFTLTGEGTDRYFIATREKALADKMDLDRRLTVRTDEDLAKYLREDLRIDEADLCQLNVRTLRRIAAAGCGGNAERLADHVAALQPPRRGGAGRRKHP